MKKFILVSTLFLLTPVIVYAKPSEEVIQNRIDKIYQICQGHDLIINENLVLVDSSTKNPITKISWTWEKDNLSNLINLVADNEPYKNYMSYRGKNDCGKGHASVSHDMIDGCQILKCGDHSLDISDTKYFLDGTEISNPQNVTNIAYNNQGNLVQGTSSKDVTPNLSVGLKNENFWLSYIYPAVSAIILNLISHFLIYPYSKQKTRIKGIILSMILLVPLSYLIMVIIKYLSKQF